MDYKIKGALFRHCASFTVEGNDRDMSRRLHEVGKIVSRDRMRITKVTITRERPLAKEQTYRIRICGMVNAVERVKRAVKKTKR